MARKQRRLSQIATAPIETKDKPRYADPFQHNVGQKIEEVGKKLEGKGRTIWYGVGALVVLAILVGIFYTWNKRTNNAAQNALGKAIEISQTRVSDAPPPAGSTEKTYKSEKERADAAIAEFQKVVDTYGGAVGEKAKYFIAVNRLTSDRGTGIQELEALAGGSTDTAKLAKFALAQTRVEDGKLDEAVTIYQQLAAMPDAVIAKDTLNFEIGKIFEKQGKKQEAADLYFNIAKAASEAKDSDGKAVPMTDTARDAKTKLTALDADRAKQITEPAPENPFGGGGIPGM